MNKKKIINDPVYGFISIQSELIFDLVQHPYFQRLRHIRQLGLTDLIYPGALHTRFHHALGAMHLMGRALENLRVKGIEISTKEFEACQMAILLHDIGHGPFSHALEETLLHQVHHESISYAFIKELNDYFDNELDLALKIFRNSYDRKFFHQLVNSQLDVDRLDYLKRDSFYTGVSEGSIGVDRIIAMLNVVNDQIVVEEKGIYNIENFLSSRRLMYWQVYLHKTAVGAERLLINLIKRAQHISQSTGELPSSPELGYFLSNNCTLEDFAQPNTLDLFGRLDDNDVWGAIKLWQHHPDKILSTLCQMLLQRHLFKIQMGVEPIEKSYVDRIRHLVAEHYQIAKIDAPYLMSAGMVTNEAYVGESKAIHILMNDGSVKDIARASDLPNIIAMSKIVKKNYLCWPKTVSLPQ